MKIDDAVFQVGEGEDKATMFSKCKMSLAKQVSFDLLENMDSVLALFFNFSSTSTWHIGLKLYNWLSPEYMV